MIVISLQPNFRSKATEMERIRRENQFHVNQLKNIIINSIHFRD